MQSTHHSLRLIVAFLLAAICSLLVFQTSASAQSPVSLLKVFSDAENQARLMITELDSTRQALFPRSLEKGQLKLITSRDWTSGFFPGELWYLYEYTHKEEWKKAAEKYTAPIEQEKTNATTHDMGFKVYCSFGNGCRLTNDPHYREVILQAARTLASRFNPRTGCIRSWDHHKELWGFPVIIDNMMNLELLFAATRLSGDSSFYRIAVSHANTTMKNHYRPDYSSWHVVDYDTATGRVVKKMTWQGYSDSSAWARGQAWGLYAFTMCYRETHDPAYLRQAEHIAAFILGHPRLPSDKIPYWDFDAPGIPRQPGSVAIKSQKGGSASSLAASSTATSSAEPHGAFAAEPRDASVAEPRDASAAAVIASGLYELSRYSRKGKDFRRIADKIVKSLTDNYRAPAGEAKGFILLHSTGAKPSNSEVDVPLNYADYYYLEALLRSR